MLGFVLAAIQLVPFAEYLTQSYVWEYRARASRQHLPAALESLATAVVPNFFGNPSKGLFLSIQNAYGVISNFNEQMLYPGIAVWVLAAVGFVARRRRVARALLCGERRRCRAADVRRARVRAAADARAGRRRGAC